MLRIPGNEDHLIPVPETNPPPQNVPSFKFVDILIKAYSSKSNRKHFSIKKII